MKKFDVITFLQDYDIDYQTKGKNVSEGWVEINCPFCDDPSKHCGINLDSTLFHCWRCGEKGDFVKLAKEVLQYSYREIRDILKEYDYYQDEDSKDDLVRTKRGGKLLLPKRLVSMKENDHKLIRDYLKSRNYDPDYLYETYKLMRVEPFHIGNWKFRLMIPVIVEGKVVTMLGMDVVRKCKEIPKYKNLPNDSSLIPTKNCLYNIDSVKRGGSCIIVEGVTDVWRLGEDSVALFGKQITTEQIKLLKQKALSRIVVMLDPDAEQQGREITDVLANIVSVPTQMVLLDQKDPSELTRKEVRKLKRLIDGT